MPKPYENVKGVVTFCVVTFVLSPFVSLGLGVSVFGRVDRLPEAGAV